MAPIMMLSVFLSCVISVCCLILGLCVNKAQRVLMVLCSALVPALPFIKSDGQNLFLF